MKNLTYSDFVSMTISSFQCGAAPDEYVSEYQINKLAKLGYNYYLIGKDFLQVINYLVCLELEFLLDKVNFL